MVDEDCEATDCACAWVWWWTIRYSNIHYSRKKKIKYYIIMYCVLLIYVRELIKKKTREKQNEVEQKPQRIQIMKFIMKFAIACSMFCPPLIFILFSLFQYFPSFVYHTVCAVASFNLFWQPIKMRDWNKWIPFILL